MEQVLFISIDGMTDPLGQSQVIPYLAGLARQGHQVTIISCEKKEKFKTGEKSQTSQNSAQFSSPKFIKIYKKL